MLMKKFLIVGMASLSLTACTFWGGDNNADPSTHITVDTNRSEYESLYDAHASVRIEGLNNALEKTLAHLHQESIGDMSLSVVIPHMITAQFSTKI